jgi:hypothetical protein
MQCGYLQGITVPLRTYTFYFSAIIDIAAFFAKIIASQ